MKPVGRVGRQENQVSCEGAEGAERSCFKLQT